jgi:hypothetical protein
MKSRAFLRTLWFALIVPAIATGGSAASEAAGESLHLHKNPLREALRPVPTTALFRMEGYYVWDPSVIKVGDTYHLFASRWPASLGMIGWKKSEVIRATSRSLFGPYEFQQVVLTPSMHPWATQAIHNPKIMPLGERFVLYHLGIPKWQTGFAFADKIEGPWTVLPGPVLATNNPAITPLPGGGFYAVGKFKPTKTKDGSWDAYMHAFTASDIQGPYTLVGGSGNRLPGDFELEDPTLWRSPAHYNVVCTDWEGKVTGLNKAVVYYTSTDGIAYRLFSPVPVWSQADPVPFADGTLMPVKNIERPQVFIDEAGAVAALLVAVRPQDPGAPTFILIRPVAGFTP